MRNFHWFFSLVFFVLLFSCSKDETLLEGETPPKFAYIVTKDKPNSLQLVEFPLLKVIDEDIFFSVNKKRLDEISQIVEYRGFIYIFQKNSCKITIATSDSLKFVAELEWKAENYKPSSIAFVNATTGFISFQDSSLIYVLDLTNFKVARKINTNFPISFLDNVNFYVLGLSFYSGNLTILDSRTYSVLNEVFIGDNPLAYGFSAEKNSIFILCVGKGKLDTNQTKTNAKLIVLNYPNFSKISEADLNIGSISAQTIVPTGIVVHGKYYGLISTLSGLLRFSVSNPKQVQRYIVGEFHNIFYDYKRDQIIALSKASTTTTIYYINPNNSAIVSKMTLNKDILLVFPK
ncbi:MAG: hypothetical protein N2560_03195 [Ignavibacteria bacterium]|nr:hypothetical protein [Ignavibacteria bacterium]